MDSHIHKKLRTDAREDRISRLPEKLIHHILLFLDARSAFRTCILSKRWKYIWTTLPFLFFDERIEERVFVKFLDHVFDRRNHGYNLLKLKLDVKDRGVSLERLNNCVEYAIDHNVEDLHVEKFTCDVSIFRSYSIKKLDLTANFRRTFVSSDDCWYLPALTSLHLKHITNHNQNLLESYLNCLPALTNLHLAGFNLPHSFSLPGLTTLHLKRCELPETVWDLPALISLELDNVAIDTRITEYLYALVSLQSLKLLYSFKYNQSCTICSPQLLYLELRTTNVNDHACIPNVSIFAPRLLNVITVGIFSITLSDSKLENVYVKLYGCFEDKITIPWGTLKQYYRQLIFMFRGLDSAKILTLDSNTIEALSAIVDLLECSSSPFHNLKYVKLPQRYKESRICGTVRNYLLGGSPGATIVTKSRQNEMFFQNAPVPLAPQNVMQEEPLVIPTLELVDSQNVHKKVCTSGIFGGLVPIANNDLGLWQGHEVNSEFVGLLDLIMIKYPQTFEHFTSNDKKLGTMKLNMLCTTIIAFTTITMTGMNTEIITEYRTLFSDLQRSFNVKWLVSHLDNIEQYLFSQDDFHAISSCVGDVKYKSQNLTTVVEEAFKTTGTTNIDASVGYIGDDLSQNLTSNLGAEKMTKVEEAGTKLESSVGYDEMIYCLIHKES